jgi:hypothetical protein
MFHGNPFSNFRVVICRQTEKHGEENMCIFAASRLERRKINKNKPMD